MHTKKNKIVVAIMFTLFAMLCACASSNNANSKQSNETAQEKDAKYANRAQNKQAMLDAMFQKFLNAISENTPADTLYEMLTDSSEYWLDTLEHHAMVYTAEDLDTCQFYEAYSILLYRLYEREHLWQVADDRMLWLYLSKAGMIRTFAKLKLGPMKIKNDRGSVGLAQSPEVPIMIFEWDDTAWKLNLAETVPLITKGIGATANKKSWSNKKMALYIIDKQYHLQYTRLDDSLYEPIGF